MKNKKKNNEYITGQKLESVAMDSGEVVITVKRWGCILL